MQMSDLIDVAAGTLSRGSFTSEDIFRLELERVFAPSWSYVGHASQLTQIGDFFLSYYEVTREANALAFARRMTDQILARATRDASGTRWVHAENRTQPENLAAQTGWMQGAAGIGAWLLRLDGFDRGRAARVVLPDSPFGR